AGNLLGAEQHGHIAAVGFDLYSKLLAEAVAELKGEPATVTVEPVISVNTEGFLPEDYVPEVNQRLAFYKRLAGASGDDAEGALRGRRAGPRRRRLRHAHAGMGPLPRQEKGRAHGCAATSARAGGHTSPRGDEAAPAGERGRGRPRGRRREQRRHHAR